MRQNRRKLFVDWGQCDPAAIVFYPQYFTWFDSCTTHLFISVGLEPQLMYQERGMLGLPLVDARAKFTAPCRYGDELEAESEIAEWGRSSFKVAHRFFNRGVLAVEGFETRIWAHKHPDDPARIKAMPIPQDVIDRFA